MLDYPGSEPHAELCVGLATPLPWALLVLRSFLTEIAKSAAHGLWKTMARRRRAHHNGSNARLVVVVVDCPDRVE